MSLKSQPFLMRIKEDSGLGLKVRNGTPGVQIFQHSMPAIIKNKPACRFRTNTEISKRNR